MGLGPVEGIPIIDDDDPRFEGDRAAWSAARKKAQALHSSDELLSGVDDPDWRVRFESIDRLVVRWKDDPRTVEAIVRLAGSDPFWQVRDRAVMRMDEFDAELVRPALVSALGDDNESVRDSAKLILRQLDSL